MNEYRIAVMNTNDHNSVEIMRCERQKLTKKELMEEFMFLGLRMTDGVSELEFERRFGVNPEDIFGSVLHRHLEQNVICRTSDHRISLTEYGLDVANYVMADYLL
jgi:oxygen-independent coproporphyrinogen-3 oxidase